MMMRVKTAMAVATTLALLVGAAMVYIALQHNPQGEAFDQETGAIHYGYVTALFVSWFVAAFVCVAAIEGAVFLLKRFARIRGARSR